MLIRCYGGQMSSNNIVFIVGSTASGKTSAALTLASKIDGEIICADSQTVRKHLNIGTAKPTQEQRAGIPHFLIDIIEPFERYNVARFKQDAEIAIADIQKRNKVPIVVGGTGLYIDALFFNYDFTEAGKERSELESLSVEELQRIIEEKGYTMPLNRTNPRHLIGVIARENNNPKNTKPREGALIVGLQRPDDELRERINSRIESMFNNGFVDEVKHIAHVYGPIPSSLDAIGYPIVQQYLNGACTEQEAKTMFKTADWRYAKRQKAWFKRNRYIQWFTDEKSLTDAVINGLESN